MIRESYANDDNTVLTNSSVINYIVTVKPMLLKTDMQYGDDGLFRSAEPWDRKSVV